MKFSIITPCFNNVDTILDTLSSVRSQKNVEIEHIIIDGGSSDGTIEKIKASSLKVDYFITEIDHGIYDAINKGVSVASGDVIGVLNADDFYASNLSLSIIQEEFLSGNWDAVYGNVNLVRPNNLMKVVRKFNSKYFRPHRLEWGLMPAHPALYLSRKIYQNNGFYDCNFKVAGDFEYIARIFTHGVIKAKYISCTIVTMRTGGASSFSFKTIGLINREMLRACQINSISTNYAKLAIRYLVKIRELLILK